MHYYKRNIGDYAKKAGRLSMLQHGSYTLLIDSCYDRERFPTFDEAIEWTWASTNEEIEAVTFILRKFFTLENGLYIQNHIKEDLDDFHAKAATNQRIALDREAKRKKNNTNRVPVVNEPPPNHKPRTINQEPLTINQEPVKIEKHRGSRLPANWVAPQEYIEFCEQERKDLDPIAMQNKFRDYWCAVAGKGGVKLDWLATWRNFVRAERINQARALPNGYESTRDKARRETIEGLTGRKRGDDNRTIDI
jgi:uncharacterized protein YdaU (DUF1376 family)